MINQSVIYDNGSQMIKLGIANQNAYPSLILQNCLGILRSEFKHNPIYPDEYVTDDETMFKQTFYSVNEPVQSQSIVNFDYFQTVFENVWCKNLALPYENQPLVFSNAMNNEKEVDQLKELFFEYYDIPQVLIQRQEILAYFASYAHFLHHQDQQNALLINSGFQKTTIVPLLSGNIKNSSEGKGIPLVKEIEKGGKDTTEFFMKGNSKVERSFEEAQNLIEYISFMNHEELNIDIKQLGITDDKQDILKQLQIANDLLYSEINPQDNIADLICSILTELDEKDQCLLLGNIIIMGGNMSSSYCQYKLLESLKQRINPTLHEKINVQVLADRKYLAYSGGYNICQHESISGQEFITKADYIEGSTQFHFL